MKSKEIITSSGKSIYIYDDLFSLAEKEFFYDFITSSYFKWGTADGPLSEVKDQISSKFNNADLERMRFTESDGFQLLKKNHLILNRSPDVIRVNLSPPYESSAVHTDNSFKGSVTVLYYVNLKWELNWNGHTLFMSDNLEDAEYTCLYKPGRVVVFDATIPHMIMTQVPRHRFSFVLQYYNSDGGIKK